MDQCEADGAPSPGESRYGQRDSIGYEQKRQRAADDGALDLGQEQSDHVPDAIDEAHADECRPSPL